MAEMTINGKDVLDLVIPPGDHSEDPITFREYLRLLLAELWVDHNFSAKRPFGNSGWHYDIYEAMVRAGMVRGSFNDDDELEDVDRGEADILIIRAIRAL